MWDAFWFLQTVFKCSISQSFYRYSIWQVQLLSSRLWEADREAAFSYCMHHNNLQLIISTTVWHTIKNQKLPVVIICSLDSRCLHFCIKSSFTVITAKFPTIWNTNKKSYHHLYITCCWQKLTVTCIAPILNNTLHTNGQTLQYRRENTPDPLWASKITRYAKILVTSFILSL